MSANPSRAAACALALLATFAVLAPALALEYPADYGSHPDYRTEWWYVTGWVSTTHGAPLGFQVTFFRSKPRIDEANPSAFTPHQLLIAHAALSDPKLGKLLHDQLIRRAGMGLAHANVGDTDVAIDRWSLVRAGEIYRTTIDAEDFRLHLSLRAMQPPMPNGDAGISRKGLSAQAVSHYYSIPHLAVEGTIDRDGVAEAVQGEAWLDHEWSNEYLESGAGGWDWIGINMNDGGALMAFRIRGANGEKRWAGATLRTADGHARAYSAGEVDFMPLRTWRSPRSGVSYPVQWQIRIGGESFDLAPLMVDQENDARLSTGAIYWEGAVSVSRAGKALGRGYLELTGYGERLQLR